MEEVLVEDRISVIESGGSVSLYYIATRIHKQTQFDPLRLLRNFANLVVMIGGDSESSLMLH